MGAWTPAGQPSCRFSSFPELLNLKSVFVPVYEYCLEPLVCVAVGAFGSGLGNAARVLHPLPRSSLPLCSSIRVVVLKTRGSA